MVASQTAEVDHKDEAVLLEEEVQRKQSSSRINNEKPINKYYKKIRENSFQWLKFKNNFAYKIANKGIFIPFKKCHKTKVLKNISNFPFSRKHSKAQSKLIEEEINNLVRLDVLSINKLTHI